MHQSALKKHTLYTNPLFSLLINIVCHVFDILHVNVDVK